MVTATKKPSLRGAQAPKVKKTDAPICRMHPDKSMVFRPAYGAWLCEEPDCNVQLLPKQIAEEDGRPIVGTGELEIIEYVDDDNVTNYVLRCAGNNVVIDITDHVTKIAKPLAAKDGAVVTFNVERWAVTDGRTKRKKRGR